ncbi:tRNA uracil 4-sulfurtransferase ThiI [Geomicrobium sp. JCM 19055]|uniref:tRNA uracil 4-sulfurtransferase ThiI n=1 Tax=Geomicrobium sp. JCM 19055 TaxID=1460649 RepID=UPI00045ED41A|nr:tRNA uracil 4-sulfurtransferase ThiI [Geomicrobium sp. JCM 19055]GAJ99402.1 tRNA S(4)U 4-thiouridine synthase [Geomicrobium sp. JCM 19055]
MKVDHILVRYGEIALKGKNRNEFEQILKGNINQALREIGSARAKRIFGRLIVEVGDEDDADQIMARLQNIFGIVSLSKAVKTTRELEDIQKAALYMMNEDLTAKTFKVTARRSYKQTPLNSQEMNYEIGSYVLRNTEHLTVDVHNPDVELHVEVREHGTYLSAGRVMGRGGLPVGSSGKTMLLLSGGIDSPVAGYLAMKRGAVVEAVHFHSPPYTNERAKQKVIDLAKQMAAYGGAVRLHLIPFTKVQQDIHQKIPSYYAMTITRRMMMRISEQVAREQRALALVNGESLGQVASQTLESIHAIEEASSLPVLRPLVTMDKTEVMDIAMEIGTYETSILPYEDCCTIFLPQESKTKPKLEKAKMFETNLDIEDLVSQSLAGKETMLIKHQDSTDEFDDLL